MLYRINLFHLVNRSYFMLILVANNVPKFALILQMIWGNDYVHHIMNSILYRWLRCEFKKNTKTEHTEIAWKFDITFLLCFTDSLQKLENKEISTVKDKIERNTACLQYFKKRNRICSLRIAIPNTIYGSICSLDYVLAF